MGVVRYKVAIVHTRIYCTSLLARHGGERLVLASQCYSSELAGTVQIPVKVRVLRAGTHRLISTNKPSDFAQAKSNNSTVWSEHACARACIHLYMYCIYRYDRIEVCMCVCVCRLVLLSYAVMSVRDSTRPKSGM